MTSNQPYAALSGRAVRTAAAVATLGLACGGSPVTPPPSSGSTKPDARFGHAMAYHASSAKVVLFGGERSVSGRAHLGDTWTWDGAAWVLAATSGPPARMDAVMVYDSGRDRIVMFGGAGAGANLTDTWEWDGRTWTRVDASAPGTRVHPTIAYDATRRRVVLFGGANDSGWLTDTWEWDGQRWERRATAGPAYIASAAFDASRGAVVALTMDVPERVATGMAVWNGTQWTSLAAQTVPPLQMLEPLVSAAAPARLMAYQSSYRGASGATWFWDGSQWTSDSGTNPGALLGYAGAFDSARQRMVVFGGLRPGEIATNDHWERDATGWRRIE